MSSRPGISLVELGKGMTMESKDAGTRWKKIIQVIAAPRSQPLFAVYANPDGTRFAERVRLIGVVDDLVTPLVPLTECEFGVSRGDASNYLGMWFADNLDDMLARVARWDRAES
jgi:hypothetical protein